MRNVVSVLETGFPMISFLVCLWLRWATRDITGRFGGWEGDMKQQLFCNSCIVAALRIHLSVLKQQPHGWEMSLPSLEPSINNSGSQPSSGMGAPAPAWEHQHQNQRYQAVLLGLSLCLWPSAFSASSFPDPRLQTSVSSSRWGHFSLTELLNQLPLFCKPVKKSFLCIRVYISYWFCFFHWILSNAESSSQVACVVTNTQNVGVA